MASMDFPVSRAVRSMTMTVMKLGLYMIRLAADVIGCELRVER